MKTNETDRRPTELIKSLIIKIDQPSWGCVAQRSVTLDLNLSKLIDCVCIAGASRLIRIDPV